MGVLQVKRLEVTEQNPNKVVPQFKIDYPGYNKFNIFQVLGSRWSLKEAIIRELMNRNDYTPGEYPYCFFGGGLKQSERGHYGGKVTITPEDFQRYTEENRNVMRPELLQQFQLRTSYGI